MAMSNYLEDKLLNHITGKLDYPAPVSLYLALLTSASSDEAQGLEVVGGSYIRQPITFNTPIGGKVTNAIDITFEIATEKWGVITDMAIFDRVEGGNMLFYSSLTTPQNVNIDNQIIFKADKLSIILD